MYILTIKLFCPECIEMNDLSALLQSELLSASKDYDVDIKDDNLYTWTAIITGPLGSLYESLKYKVLITFPPTYPYDPPIVGFITPCFHPNVDREGKICLDVLKKEWKSDYNVYTVLTSLVQLLVEPNVESPLDSWAAILWQYPTKYRSYLLKKHVPCD
jgi:ubiquitin-conjugating enzyme E2 C